MSTNETIHVFNIPKEIVDNLVFRSTAPLVPTPITSHSRPASPLTSLTCTTCKNAVFPTIADKRDHFRTGWHLHNAKRRLESKSRPISERKYRKMNGLDDEDDDASSSSSSEEESEDEVDSEPEEGTIHGSPLTWFTSSVDLSIQYGIYTVIFPGLEKDARLDAVKTLQERGTRGRTWAVFMVGGGHFAGAIVRVSEPDKSKNGYDSGSEGATGSTKNGKEKVKSQHRKEKSDMEVLRHKAFHRYTSRRKQGGTQSTKDNSKNKQTARSAGGILRRYGEQALQDDIRGLLSEWAEDIQKCDLIFLKANSPSRRIFLDYEGCVLRKDDTRLRTLPFQTRRPTQDEVKKAVTELIHVKVIELPREEVAVPSPPTPISTPSAPPPDPRRSSSPLPKSAVPPVSKPKPSEKSVQSALSTVNQQKYRRLLEMITKGRVEALKTFWARECGEGGEIQGWLVGKRLGRLLQIASESGQEEIVRWMLFDLRADPTIPVPSTTSRTTAYDLASTKEVRSVFRRCAYAHPDWWDWLGSEGAKVPTALSPDMEDGQERKKKEWIRKRVRQKNLETGKEEFSEDGIRIYSAEGQ